MTTTWPLTWQARWIWASDAPAGVRNAVALGVDFTLDEVPDRVPCRWHAVSGALVKLGEIEVGRGPIRANPNHGRFEHVDLAPFLRVGVNRIDVIAWNYAGATAWFRPPPPFATDLADGGFVLEADLGDRWLVTDTSWHARPLVGWGSTPADGVGGRGIETWPIADTEPAPAVERRAMAVGEPEPTPPPTFPIGPHAPRPTSPLTRREVSLVPGRVRAEGIVAGTVIVDVEGPPDATATVRLTEFVDGDRPRPTVHDPAVRVTTDGTRRRIETIDRYAGQGLVVDADDGVTVHDVQVVERLHPVVGDHGFSCDDPLLERVRRVGRRTVSLNSVDAYTDCPTREQRAWTGDGVVHQLVDLTTNDDWTLARRHVWLGAESARSDGMLPMAAAGDAEEVDFTVIPDWSLHWVHSVWNVYRHVGDLDEIAALLPTVERVLRWFDRFVDDGGALAGVPGWVLIDWSAVQGAGSGAALNGLWGRALRAFAKMARAVGDEGRARWAAARHDCLVAGFERFWDADRGRYRDHVGGPWASEHAQAAAIVGGVAPPERWGRLVEVLQSPTGRVHAVHSHDGPAGPGTELPVGGPYLRAGQPAPWWSPDELVVAQPFFAYVVHDALAAAGRADAVVERCRRWEVLFDRCPTSWSETWFGGSLSHGWSSTPTRDLAQRTLGITPDEPGFTVARLAPALGDLRRAAGSVPTPHGPIAVELEAGDDGRVRGTVTSPVPVRVGGRTLDAGSHDL